MRRSFFPRPRRAAVASALAVLPIAVLIVLADAAAAQAALFPTVEDITNWFNSLLIDTLWPLLFDVVRTGCSAFSGTINLASDIAQDATWLIPTGTNLSAAADALPIGGMLEFSYIAYDRGIKPMCEAWLALLVLIRLIEMMQEPDNNPHGVPYLEKTMWLLVRFVLLKLALDRAFDIAVFVFNTIAGAGGVLFKAVTTGEAGSIMQRLLENVFSVDGGTLDGIDVDTVPVSAETKQEVLKALVAANPNMQSVGSLLGIMLVDIIPVLISALVLKFLVSLSVYARFMQLFAHLAFAPMAVVCYANENTRQIALSYVKSIAASALAFVMLVLVLLSMKYTLPNSLNFFVNGSSPGIVVMCILYCTVVTKAGGWAREIVGG